jgi:CelD/BcsL family acetyltransferase involved in cellulose biosynthesis
MYTVKTATIKEFVESKDAWDALAASMPLPSIFCTWEWIYTWWEHFGAGYALHILFVYDGPKLMGILPLAFQRTLVNREWSIGRILAFCGSRELYPDHLDVITAKEHAEQCLEALCGYLAVEFRDWDVCQLPLSAEGSNLVSWFGNDRTIQQYGFGLATQRASFAHFIPIAGSFEDYLNTLDTKQRYNLRSRKKKLEKEGFSFKPCDPVADEKGLDTLFEIHGLRSKQKNIRSTFNDADILEFHKSLAKRIQKSGWLSLRFLQNDKQTIAASYNFIYQGRVFSYQKGMDPQWERYGPGKAIVYEAIHEAFANGCTEYNFLQGNEEYKSGWTQDSRPLFTLTLYNTTAAGVLSQAMAKLKRIIRKIKPV